MTHTRTGPLPPHLALVAEAVEAPLPAPLTADEVAAPIGRLVEALAVQAARLPEGSSVVVDPFTLTRALQCPASRSLEPEGPPFAWSPHTSARWLGMKALEAFATGHSNTVAAAVAAACDGVGTADREAEGRPWGPPVWLRDEASPGARAATVAAARQWAEQAVQWVPWSRWRAPAHRLRFDPNRKPWPSGTRRVGVKARWEADLRPDATTRSRVQLLLVGAVPGSAAASTAVQLAALGGWLAEPRPGRGPARVVCVHPAGGEVVAVPVEADLLGAAADAVITAATTLVDAVLTEPLVTSPGPACRWCPRASACEDGTVWLRRPDRRVAGLPVG
jgi:hypothetical protein